ncbi:MAG: hypothetical protein HZB38_15135 [Planctomycetes bacterium]|nr:hypothetical protein [Planctomycetota bacterium]
MQPKSGGLRPAGIAAWVNLFVPGGGLIMRNRVATGLLLGIAFAAGANLTIAARLLFPDDFSPAARGGSAALAALAYILAQFLLPAAGPRSGRRSASSGRRTALASITEALRQGRIDESAIAELTPLAERDLHVAYRLAQAASLEGDAERSTEAWARVKRLDRHRIYREETDATLQPDGR